MSDLTRTYVCPACGYDGFRMSELKLSGITDFNLQPGCPRCQTVEGRTVWLEETSDPRAIADAQDPA